MSEKVSAKRGLGFQDGEDVEITIATNAGACFGVVRAIKLGFQAADRGLERKGPVYSFGPLIHNPHVVRDLAAKGVQTVSSSDEVRGGTVVLRSHGVPKATESELRERGVQVIDATCPLVKKPQRIARSLGERGYFLIVVGDKKHPEVQGVLSYLGSDRCLVTYDPADVEALPGTIEKVGCLAQTTIEAGIFDAVVAAARKKFADVQVYNTICDATSIRQTEAMQLAQVADVLVVVGGKNSSNTTKLVKICRDQKKETYHIESMSELDPAWFRDKRKIGVTGGASTPHDFVDAVGSRIAELISNA